MSVKLTRGVEKKLLGQEKRRCIDVAHVMFQCQMQFVVLLHSRIKGFMD